MTTVQSSVRLDDLLVFTRRAEVSDLHLTVGVPPVLRIDGQLRAIEGFKPLMPSDTRSLCMELLDEHQMGVLETEREIDLSFGRRGAGRYRLNVYWQRGSIGLAIRVIRSTIPTIDELGLPQITKQFAMSDKGLLPYNKRYLGHDEYTDVITFDLQTGTGISGDILISYDRVRDNAKTYGVSAQQELHRVMVHGLLHLMGHSDKSAAKRKAMRQEEDKYLALL